MEEIFHRHIIKITLNISLPLFIFYFLADKL